MKLAPKKRDNRSSKIANARKKVTHAVSIYRHPKSKDYLLYIGSGRGDEARLALLAAFPTMNQETKAHIRIIREAIAGLIAGRPAFKYKSP